MYVDLTFNHKVCEGETPFPPSGGIDFDLNDPGKQEGGAPNGAEDGGQAQGVHDQGTALVTAAAVTAVARMARVAARVAVPAPRVARVSVATAPVDTGATVEPPSSVATGVAAEAVLRLRLPIEKAGQERGHRLSRGSHFH